MKNRELGSLSKKFFSERELRIECAKVDGNVGESASMWYSSLRDGIDDLPIYMHTNTGMRIDDVNSLKSKPAWFFRGQENSDWGFHSTLYRICANSSQAKNRKMPPRKFEEQMASAEIAMLKIASENGVGRELTSLETLTLLQHHGSPTRLIDVTTDWKVALYFACEGSECRDGRLFLISVAPERWEQIIKIQDDGDAQLPWIDYGNSFRDTTGIVPNYAWLSGVWPILLPFSDPRMIAQRGFFLVGGIPSLKGKGNLYTSKCSVCSKRFCQCDDQCEAYGSIKSPLTVQEYREISSLSVYFRALKRSNGKQPLFSGIRNDSRGKWSALGFSVRIPGRYKVHLRALLEDEGICRDSLYPPLSEMPRLLRAVAAGELFSGGC